MYDGENSLKEYEDGECSGSENGDSSDEITPDISVNTESEREDEQGLLLYIYIYIYNNPFYLYSSLYLCNIAS